MRSRTSRLDNRRKDVLETEWKDPEKGHRGEGYLESSLEVTPLEQTSEEITGECERWRESTSHRALSAAGVKWDCLKMAAARTQFRNPVLFPCAVSVTSPLKMPVCVPSTSDLGRLM